MFNCNLRENVGRTLNSQSHAQTPPWLRPNCLLSGSLRLTRENLPVNKKNKKMQQTKQRKKSQRETDQEKTAKQRLVGSKAERKVVVVVKSIPYLNNFPQFKTLDLEAFCFLDI